MQKLDWYIIKKFLGTFFFTIALILLIVIVFDISEKIYDFLEHEVSVKSIIVDYYFNFIHFFGNLFSPLFIFISVIFFTSEGTINLKNKKWENDYSPLDTEGTSFVDNSYTKAYVQHLFKSNELLGKQIASLHNIRFYLWLMEQAQKQLETGTFTSWKNKIVKKLDTRL